MEDCCNDDEAIDGLHVGLWNDGNFDVLKPPHYQTFCLLLLLRPSNLFCHAQPRVSTHRRQ